MKTNLSTEQIKQIPQWVQEGKNSVEIAVMLACSKFTVTRWIKILRAKGYEVPPIKKGRKSKLE